MSRICALGLAVFGLVLGLPASAAGLRVPVSAFGVASPDYPSHNAQGAEEGDLTTIGRSRLRYALLDQPDVTAGVGLSNWDPARAATQLFTGRSYVPLLHAFGEYRFWRSFRIGGDIDALGGSQGRTLNAGMRLSYDFSPAWSVSAAYRLYREGDELRFDPVEQGRVSFGTRLRF
ncbi:hypothetical protein OPU71_08885 [Niveibacterium sp. 24ML]|uniref:hypothetical protein n=1 Tax=Niveibacterium sp. 24ML TaxID=2985512 RepID=UPI00226F3102|nr:hypothetical protein [Niveibacterium sp. 24ML]MCX9156234.1 hypothetical protein [Niveibacterium sp. 24ML]